VQNSSGAQESAATDVGHNQRYLAKAKGGMEQTAEGWHRLAVRVGVMANLEGEERTRVQGGFLNGVRTTGSD
jgi:hypothetical protein